MRRMAPTRRGLLGAMLATGAGCPCPISAAANVPEAATVIAPGPEDGPAAAFAMRAARGLARGLVQAAALRVTVLGGPDGITAANRFAASAAPDGRMLLVLPGLAALALLIGDSRARYEPRHWPAISGSLMPAALAVRENLTPGAPLRLALAGPSSPEAAALLALDLLGRAATPLVLPTGISAETAVAQGAADALVLAGPAIPARAAALRLQPVFAFDSRGAARDPGLPDVPALGEVLPDPPRMELMEAARAAGAALRTRGLLVLPPLTSADAVALWRGAAQRWTDEATTVIEAGTRRLLPEEASAALAALCPPPEVALAYREWLQRRFGFRTG